MRTILLIFTGILLSLQLSAQDPKLADQYFQNGEFEKAATLYESLSKLNNGDYYFDRYVECLYQSQQYDECEKVLQKQLKKDPKRVLLYVTYGNVLERQNRDKEAAELYQKAIDKMTADRFAITNIANAFLNLTKYDLALQTYEKGAELLKNKFVFAFSLAELYRRKDDRPRMVESYLNSIADNPGNLPTVQAMLQRYIENDEDYAELQRQLYARIQETPDAVYYPEMLIWVFLQKKDYKSAFRQAKALDRQLDENGGRVYNIAEVANNDKDYEAAIQGYEYIATEKGPGSPFYIESKRDLLTCKRKKLVEGYSYTQEDLRILEQEYETYLTELGKSKVTATIVAELADLEAFYLNDLPKAVSLLSEMINYPGIDRLVQANGKLSLGDFYLMQGEVWEATLLYSQVDKAFKDDALGHEARFRNAKLSYYNGDFEWAQTQFDVLKSSTSKLISNDAIDMSVFIMDHLGLDTTTEPMRLYADAELLVFQNRFNDAFQKLDSIGRVYPGHSLEGDIQYLEAHIYVRLRDYDKAVARYQTIIDKYADGIRCDNAIFELAGLYANQLKDKEKAKQLYEKLFIDFSGSTLAVEARKKYRELRGDGVQ